VDSESDSIESIYKQLSSQHVRKSRKVKKTELKPLKNILELKAKKNFLPKKLSFRLKTLNTISYKKLFKSEDVFDSLNGNYPS